MKKQSRILLAILAGIYAFSSSAAYAAEGVVDVKDFEAPLFSTQQATALKDQFVFWLGKHYRCLYGGKCTQIEKAEVVAQWKRWIKNVGIGTALALLAYFGRKSVVKARKAIYSEMDIAASRFEDKLDKILGITDLRLSEDVERRIRSLVMDDQTIPAEDKERVIEEDKQNALIELRAELRKEAIAAIMGAAAGSAIAANQEALVNLSKAIVADVAQAILHAIDQGVLAKEGDVLGALTVEQRKERVKELTQQTFRAMLHIPAEQEIAEEGLMGAVIEQVLRKLETRGVHVPWMGQVSIRPLRGAAEQPVQPGQFGYAGAGALPDVVHGMGVPSQRQGFFGGWFGAGRRTPTAKKQ